MTAEVTWAAGRPAQVFVFVEAGSAGAAAVERAYHAISTALLGTPGLLGNRLLRDAARQERFIVVSEWADLEAFRTWEEGPAHKAQTAPLRAFIDQGAGGQLFVQVAAYSADPQSAEQSAEQSADSEVS